METSERRTKIVATLGPATRSPEMVRKLIEAGVNVFRLNFSHGTLSEHAENIRTIRQASEEMRRHVAILQDLQGPKIRVGEFAGHKPVDLKAGARVHIVTTPLIGSAERFFTTYEPLPDDVRPGDQILLDDGRLVLKVISIQNREVVAEVVVGGMLSEHKGMNLPGTPLSAPCLTDKDLTDLRMGLAEGVDFVGLSFVRQARDVEDLRHRMKAEGRIVPIIAKIERIEAIDNLVEIVQAADGVMVARGDLGVETSAAEVPILQKRILAITTRHGKPDITATQMLETMVSNPSPSRAEAADVANAVFDGTDAVMLSAETAVGRYPVEAVRAMGQIAAHAEEHYEEFQRSAGASPLCVPSAVADAAAHAACVAARELHARVIALFTLSGRTAFLVAARRPSLPIMAFSPHPETCRRLALAWGVRPHLVEMVSRQEDLAGMADSALRHCEGLHDGDLVVMLIGSSLIPGATNIMRIHRIGTP